MNLLRKLQVTCIFLLGLLYATITLLGRMTNTRCPRAIAASIARMVIYIKVVQAGFGGTYDPDREPILLYLKQQSADVVSQQSPYRQCCGGALLRPE